MDLLNLTEEELQGLFEDTLIEPESSRMYFKFKLDGNQKTISTETSTDILIDWLSEHTDENIYPDDIENIISLYAKYEDQLDFYLFKKALDEHLNN